MKPSLFRYLFLDRGVATRTVVVEEVRTRRTNHPSSDHSPGAIVVQINRLLAVISLTSFAVIVYYALFREGRSTPDLISQTFSATLGYFVSSSVSYFEQSRQPR
jgi:hypothetical protein